MYPPDFRIIALLGLADGGFRHPRPQHVARIYAVHSLTAFAVVQCPVAAHSSVVIRSHPLLEEPMPAQLFQGPQGRRHRRLAHFFQADVGELTKSHGEVGSRLFHQIEQRGEQHGIVRMLAIQAQFSTEGPQQGRLVEIVERFQGPLDVSTLRFGENRSQSLVKFAHVEIGDAWLSVQCVHAGVIGQVRHEMRVVSVDEAERPIIDGDRQQAEVVRVADAVRETQAHPLDHQVDGSILHEGEKANESVRVVEADRGPKMMPDNEVGQAAEQVVLSVLGQNFQGPDAEPGRGQAQHDGRLLAYHVTVVEGVAQNQVV